MYDIHMLTSICTDHNDKVETGFTHLVFYAPKPLEEMIIRWCWFVRLLDSFHKMIVSPKKAQFLLELLGDIMASF